MAQRPSRPWCGGRHLEAPDDRRLQRALRPDADAEAPGRIVHELVGPARYPKSRDIMFRRSRTYRRVPTSTGGVHANDDSRFSALAMTSNLAGEGLTSSNAPS